MVIGKTARIRRRFADRMPAQVSGPSLSGRGLKLGPPTREVLFRVLVSVLVVSVAVPARAAAANVLPMAGEVRIRTGQGFQEIVRPTEVAAGAQVMVSPGGLATITYSDSCVVRVAPARITVVENRSPCSDHPEPSYLGFTQSNKEGISISADGLAFTPMVDDPEPSGGVSETKPVTSPTPEMPMPPETAAAEEEKDSWNYSLLAVGAVVVGAGALAAILVSSGDDPASP